MRMNKNLKEKILLGQKCKNKVFGIDVLAFIKCGGKLKPISSIMDGVSIQKYLTHIGENPVPPSRAPPNTIYDRLLDD